MPISTIKEIALTTVYLILLFLVAFAIAVPISVASGRVNDWFILTRLSRLAEKAQFTLHKDLKREQTHLMGQVKGHQIRIHAYYFDKWNHTAIETPVSNPWNLRLSVKQRTLFDWFSRTPRIGDPTFDVRYFIKCSPKELAAHLLDADTRRTLLKYRPEQFELRGELLQVKHFGVVGSVPKVLALSEFVAGMAGKVEKLSKAHKDSSAAGPATLPPIEDEDGLDWLRSLPGADDPAAQLTPEEMQGARRNFTLLMIFFALIILFVLVFLATYIVLWT